MSRSAAFIGLLCCLVSTGGEAQTSTGGGASGGGVSGGTSSGGISGGGVSGSPGGISGGASPRTGGTSPNTLTPQAPLRPTQPTTSSDGTASPGANNAVERSPGYTRTAPGSNDDTVIRPQPLPNQSGAPPQAATEAPIGPDDNSQAGAVRDPNVETGGGAARTGATGRTVEECMAAWEPETHMSKENWRETCERTLQGPHI